MLIKHNMILTTVLGGIVFLTACGAGPSDVAIVPGQPETPGRPVTIEWWQFRNGDKENAALKDAANSYSALHPNVKFNIVIVERDGYKAKLDAAYKDGKLPDIFSSYGGRELARLAEAGLLRDLTDDIRSDGFAETIQPAALSLYSDNGRVYGVPWSVSLIGFWYRKDLFRKAGIEKTPATYEELLATVTALRNAGTTPIALGMKDKWPGQFYWEANVLRLGGASAFSTAYSRTGGFTTEPFVQAGAELKDLIDMQPFQKGFLEASYFDQIPLTANGQAAMELMGSWAYAAGSANLKDQDLKDYQNNIGWFPYPMMANTKAETDAILGGADGFAVGKNAPIEAVEFLKFFLSADHQAELYKTGVIVLPVVAGLEEEITNPLIRAQYVRARKVGYIQPTLTTELPSAAATVLADEVQKLFAGIATPVAIANAIETAARPELKP